jgi:protein-S-isoprenylcysteine O-methyltransferase Ste14
MIFDVQVLSSKYNQIVGLFLIILGSMLIFWAQKSSKPNNSQITKPIDDSYFTRGPYKYNRNPTHVGLTTMTYGLAFMVNSLATVIFVFLAYVITKVFFITKEEKLLEKRYGEIYLKYKRKVRSWI